MLWVSGTGGGRHPQTWHLKGPLHWRVDRQPELTGGAFNWRLILMRAALLYQQCSRSPGWARSPEHAAALSCQ